jgi:hypothetical protein
MAAYTDTLGFYKGSAGYDGSRVDRVSLLNIKLDFAAIAAARTAAAATALAPADTLVVFQVPAGSLVLGGGIEVTRVETTAPTATLGLGTASAYAAAAPMNALGHTTIALAAPVAYAAAATVILTINTAVPLNGVARAYLLVANLNGP